MARGRKYSPDSRRPRRVTVYLNEGEYAYIARCASDLKVPWGAYAAGLLLSSLHIAMGRECASNDTEWRVNGSRADLTGVQQ